MTTTFEVRAVITTPATTAPDPDDQTKRLATGPEATGYYTLTNTGTAPYDLGDSVRFFAYWKVPAGFCARFNTNFYDDLVFNHIPVPRVSRGQELCPLAFGDSTLPGIPLTLRPRTPATITILSTTMLFGKDQPFTASPADAAIAARVTKQPPAAWYAADDDLTRSPYAPVASTGLPTP